MRNQTCWLEFAAVRVTVAASPGGEIAVVDNVAAVVVIICKIGLRNGVRCVVAETGGAVCFKISCGLNLFCISRAINSLTQLVDGSPFAY